MVPAEQAPDGQARASAVRVWPGGGAHGARARALRVLVVLGAGMADNPPVQHGRGAQARGAVRRPAVARGCGGAAGGKGEAQDREPEMSDTCDGCVALANRVRRLEVWQARVTGTEQA